VFIESALNARQLHTEPITILEVGFGTGLNALLSCLWANDHKIRVEYIAVEPFPLSESIVQQLNYTDILRASDSLFFRLHRNSEENLEISSYFNIRKSFLKIEDSKLPQEYFEIVFFDAFSPDAHPEMWTKSIFSPVFHSMKKGGILTTYSSKGIVKRALRASGFEVEKLPGPPGKREILRALKKNH
jgi:tRNA U34 5-methylaminomethyl-2-thiouridine-forming methyltransferase MnmC